MKMTKKIVFWISFIGVALGLVSSLPSFYTFCFQGGHCWRLWEIVNSTGPYFFLFPPLLLLSLITYRAKDEVFRTWFYFACGWVPLSIVLILLASGGSGGGFGIPTILDQEFIAMILAALFFIISLVLIVWRYLVTRNK